MGSNFWKFVPITLFVCSSLRSSPSEIQTDNGIYCAEIASVSLNRPTRWH